jgi:glycosyltransferase involved in cell wall biosynthesis
MMSSPILTCEQNVERIPGVDRESMSICLVGGIYDKGSDYRSMVKATPETILERGLRERGHRVLTQGHHGRINFQDSLQNNSRAIDIIHIHHLGVAGLAAATDSSTAAFVYTSHDGPAMAGLSKGIFNRLASQFIMTRADAVVALSQAESEFQRRNYSLQGAIHAVIPNGIDTENFQYLRNNGAGRGQPWQVLFVGQLVEIKEVDRLIRALALLPRNIELLLAFHVDTLRGRLEQLARQLGLQNHVHFLGSKTPDELKTLYQHADLFVLPSVGEALPSVITEAMLCGTPVVATDVGGIRDQLGGYGMLVPPRKTEALARAIGDVLAHYDEFKARGAEMSEYAMQRFSIQAMVESHIDLYGSLLKKKTVRRRNLPTKLPMNFAANLAARTLCKK